MMDIVKPDGSGSTPFKGIHLMKDADKPHSSGSIPFTGIHLSKLENYLSAVPHN